MNAKLVSTKEILHPAQFNSGPRISRVDTVEFNGNRFEVEFWTENGKLVKIGEPRKIS